MEALGSPTLMMLPYDAKVLVKRKRWHDQGNLLAQPFVESRILCPSPDMTQGWLVKTKDGHVMHARDTIMPDPAEDQARLQLEEATVPEKLGHSLREKQPPPGVVMRLPPRPRENRGGESGANDVEKSDEKLGDEVEKGEQRLEGEVDDIFGDSEEDNPRMKALGRDGKHGMCRTQDLDTLEKYLVEKHQRVLDQLSDLLDMVPINKMSGELCGMGMERLTREREWLEADLERVDHLQGLRLSVFVGFKWGVERTQVRGRSSKPRRFHLVKFGPS